MTAEDARAPGDPPPATIPIVLRALPLEAWSGLRQWLEEVQRELALAGLSQNRTAQDTLDTLAWHLDREARLLGTPDRGRARMWDALDAGRSTADISYVVDPGVAESSQELLGLLEMVDDLCRSEQLLTLPMSPTQRTFAQWYFGEIRHQVAGAAPVPWTDARQAAP